MNNTRHVLPERSSRDRAMVCCARSIVLCALILSPFDGGSQVTSPPAVGVSIGSSGPDKATLYSATRGSCTITWTAYHSETDKGIIKHSAICPETLSAQLTSLIAILSTFLEKDPAAPFLRTFFWGGLWPDRMPNSLEMPQRLALAAFRSNTWDAVRGRPANGRDVNGVVREIANGKPIYPELKELFGRFQRDIRISAVEKVRVMPAKDLPFYDQLRKDGVPPSAKLPFDCMTWFSVTAAALEPARQ